MFRGSAELTRSCHQDKRSCHPLQETLKWSCHLDTRSCHFTSTSKCIITSSRIKFCFQIRFRFRFCQCIPKYHTNYTWKLDISTLKQLNHPRPKMTFTQEPNFYKIYKINTTQSQQHFHQHLKHKFMRTSSHNKNHYS